MYKRFQKSTLRESINVWKKPFTFQIFWGEKFCWIFIFHFLLLVVVVVVKYVTSFEHQLMVFHWSLSDIKSPLVSGTILSILVALNNAVVEFYASYFPGRIPGCAYTFCSNSWISFSCIIPNWHPLPPSSVYSFCANLLHLLTMGLIVSSLTPHDQRLQFCCVLLIFALK